jgi:hypothetical protein
VRFTRHKPPFIYYPSTGELKPLITDYAKDPQFIPHLVEKLNQKVVAKTHGTFTFTLHFNGGTGHWMAEWSDLVEVVETSPALACARMAATVIKTYLED